MSRTSASVNHSASSNRPQIRMLDTNRGASRVLLHHASCSWPQWCWKRSEESVLRTRVYAITITIGWERGTGCHHGTYLVGLAYCGAWTLTRVWYGTSCFLFRSLHNGSRAAKAGKDCRACSPIPRPRRKNLVFDAIPSFRTRTR